jgi:hypothetical protein
VNYCHKVLLSIVLSIHHAHPFQPDEKMLPEPHYNYFAASIQEYEQDLTSFKITIIFLPPDWLGARGLPALEAVGERQ